MTETSNNYARVLYELSICREAIDEAKRIFSQVPKVEQVLKCPIVSLREKEQVIDRIFPEDIRRFLKVVCRHQKMDGIMDIFLAYEAYRMKMQRGLKAELRYVTPPTKAQKDGLEAFLRDKFQVEEIDLELKEDKGLIGGFVLLARGHEYDWSLLGRYKKLRQKLTRR